jgi:hypothetical protein
MFAKGKGSAVPSDGQAREKLALYVYEYLLHVGAQKSAQTFLSEIRWEKKHHVGRTAWVSALVVVRILGPLLCSS